AAYSVDSLGHMLKPNGVGGAIISLAVVFFFSSRRRHTRLVSDWSSDVCSSDLTATAADEEFNETEFPQALATVAGKLRADNGEKVSILKWYRQTVAEVEARFAADKRVPTEHAQLDDNGDGIGTEQPVVEPDGDKK